MTSARRDLYADLAWLPGPPADFRERCRAVARGEEDSRAIRRLAGFALNENELRCLAQVIETRRAEGRTLAPLTPFRLGLVGNATLETIVPALVATAARHGIALECVCAAFGQTIQEASSADSRVNRSKPDAVLIALDHRALDSTGLLDDLRDGFRAHAGAVSILQTVPPPPESLFGSLDRAVAGTLRSRIGVLNAALVERVRDSGDVLLDVAALAETVGLAQWHSPTQWHVAKLAFSARLVPLYADHVCRVIGALLGKSRRCIVLDLDDTLWGGVVGDDGLDGIRIGQGDATGEAYTELQQALLALRSRGIVLAVSSKNDDELARSVFRLHPEMSLRESHIAVFQANWNDKASNVEAIARELELGLDALVFFDDNPAERGLVRAALPDVAVPELPADPALYTRTLAAAGYFEAVAFSEEDRERARYYEDNSRRAALEARTGRLEDYLASLDMKISFKPFDARGRSRVAQLVNKSNQFNLTSRRYSELDIAALESDPELFTLQVRLSDAFGDNGMIAVVICRARPGHAWEIDTWLMSCRVLGRGVERMILRELLRHARTRAVDRLIGIFVPTQRNEMVRDHYRKLGFRLIREDAAGCTTWGLDAGAEIEPAPMSVDRAGFELAAAAT